MFVMTRVERIEKDIRELSSEELAKLREWFRRFDSDAWDEQIAHDADAGRLDRFGDQAVSEHRDGRTREL